MTTYTNNFDAGLVVSVPLHLMQTCSNCGYSFAVAVVSQDGRTAKMNHLEICPVCRYNNNANDENGGTAHE